MCKGDGENEVQMESASLSCSLPLLRRGLRLWGTVYSLGWLDIRYTGEVVVYGLDTRVVVYGLVGKSVRCDSNGGVRGNAALMYLRE